MNKALFLFFSMTFPMITQAVDSLKNQSMALVEASDEIAQAVDGNDVEKFKALLDQHQFIFELPLHDDLGAAMEHSPNPVFKQIFALKRKEYKKAKETAAKEKEEQEDRAQISKKIAQAVADNDLDTFRALLDKYQCIFQHPLHEDLQAAIKFSPNQDFRQVWKFKLGEYNRARPTDAKTRAEDKKQRGGQKSQTCDIL